LLSGHFLGDLTIGVGALVGLLTVAFVFFINIHLPVLGFNTLLSGHFLGDLTIGLTGDLTICLTGDLTICLTGDLTIGLAGDLTVFAPLFFYKYRRIF
jgi:hypothetical protein